MKTKHPERTRSSFWPSRTTLATTICAATRRPKAHPTLTSTSPSGTNRTREQRGAGPLADSGQPVGWAPKSAISSYHTLGSGPERGTW